MSRRPEYLKLVSDVDRAVSGFGIDVEAVAGVSNDLEREVATKLKREDDRITALVLAAYGLIESSEGYKTFLSAVKVCRLASEGALATA